MFWSSAPCSNQTGVTSIVANGLSFVLFFAASVYGSKSTNARGTVAEKKNKIRLDPALCGKPRCSEDPSQLFHQDIFQKIHLRLDLELLNLLLNLLNLLKRLLLNLVKREDASNSEKKQLCRTNLCYFVYIDELQKLDAVS